MVSRRRVLSTTTLAVAALAGCSSAPPSAEERVAIASVEVTNRDDVPREVTVRVTDGDAENDAVRFEESVTVDAGGSRTLESPVDGRGAYSIAATTSDASVAEEVVAFADEDDSCVLPVIRIDGGDLFAVGRSYDSC